MKTFNSLAQFAMHLEKVVKSYPLYEAKAANVLGEALKQSAKDKIGHLQSGSGPFSAWAPLAESTKTDKTNKGYVYNSDYNPLYRTGELKESIHFVFYQRAHTLFLGSDSEVMVYQEKGTSKIPPRSVLGLTMFRAVPIIRYVMSNMMKDWISGQPLRMRKPKNGSL